MSENTAIVHLHEYPLTWAEIQALPEDQQAVLAVLSYAVSEANALSRIYLSASHSLTGKSAIDCAISIQRFVALRTWSSRLFEAVEFLDFKSGKQTKDQDILDLAQSASHEFSLLRKSEGYRVARDVRNEATHHYSFAAAKKNLKHVSNRANCTMYLHELNGNSYYPLGEEVLFIGRLGRRGAQLQNDEQISAMLESWLDWNKAANKWLNHTHYTFVRQLILERKKDKYARKTSYWIAPELVASVRDCSTPIFVSRDE